MHRFPRAFLILIASCASASLGGCAHRVELPGVARFADYDLPSYRKAADIDAEGAARGDYAVDWKRPGRDYIQFTLSGQNSSSEVKSTGLRLSTDKIDCETEACQALCLPAGYMNEVQDIVQSGSTRLPLSVLRRAPALKVITYHFDERGDIAEDTVYSVPLCGEGGHRLAKVSASKDVLGVLASGKGDFPVTMKLIAEEPTRALPGDQLRISILSQDSNKLNDQSSQLRSVVDRQGYAFIPAVASAVNDAVDSVDSAKARAWVNDIDLAAFRIRVWRPGRPFPQQPTLDEIGRCLAIGWRPDKANFAGEPEDVDRCLDANIDGQTFAIDTADLRRVRYDIRAEQSWTLVLQNGDAVQLAFVPGESALAAVSAAYRARRGRLLAAKRRLFLTIDPSPTLGEPSAFYAVIKRGVGPDKFADVLLAPGDTVHLTESRPGPRREESE